MKGRMFWMQRITRQELRNLSNRVLTFYKMRMNISSDIYCVDIEALATVHSQFESEGR